MHETQFRRNCISIAMMKVREMVRPRPGSNDWMGNIFCYKDRRAKAPDKNRSTVAIPYLKIPNRYLIMAGGYSISSIQ